MPRLAFKSPIKFRTPRTGGRGVKEALKPLQGPEGTLKSILLKIMTNLFSQQEYLANSEIWGIDETFFNPHLSCFIVLGLKSRMILGFIIIGKPLDSAIILELYQQILKQGFSKPKAVHGDNKPVYWSPTIHRFLKQNDIDFSKTYNTPRTNQTVESINNVLKGGVVKFICKKFQTKNQFKKWRKTWPAEFKNLSIIKKSQNAQFRKLLFETKEFCSHGILLEALHSTIFHYNSQQCPTTSLKISRHQYATYDSFVVMPALLVQAPEKTLEAEVIKANNDYNLQAVQQKIQAIWESKTSWEAKEAELQKLEQPFLEAPPFVLIQCMKHLYGLYQSILLNQDNLHEDNLKLQNQLSELIEYKRKVEAEQKAKEQRRLKRLNRLRRPPTREVTYSEYEELVKYFGKNTYRFIRARLAFCVMASTGIRFKEMQQLTVGKLIHLFVDGKCPIDRVKRGRSNYTAFLHPVGQKFFKERKQDYDYMVELKIAQLKKEGRTLNELPLIPLFSPQGDVLNKVNHDHFLNDLNLLIGEFCQSLNIIPKCTTHSFRYNFMQQLWKDDQDIVHIAYYMGHSSITVTSRYLGQRSPLEMENAFRKAYPKETSLMFKMSDFSGISDSLTINSEEEEKTNPAEGEG